MTEVCTKAFYLDQGSAVLALDKIHERAAKKGKPARLPVRAYPCDVCDGWHLTAKQVAKTPPWEHDPNWVRPGGTAHLQQRSAEVVIGETRRARRRARRNT